MYVTPPPLEASNGDTNVSRPLRTENGHNPVPNENKARPAPPYADETGIASKYRANEEPQDYERVCVHTSEIIKVYNWVISYRENARNEILKIFLTPGVWN